MLLLALTCSVGAARVSADVCNPVPGVIGQDASLSLQHDGEARHFVLHLPDGYDCSTPLPLLIGVHGYTGTGSNLQNEWMQIFDHVNEHGYIAVFPDGMAASPSAPWATGFNDIGSLNDDGPDGPTCKPPPYDYPVFENCPDSVRDRECYWGNSCADDLGFFRALIDWVSTEFAVDSHRIYLTGYSQGGSTVNFFAKELAGLLAAAAPLHGFQTNGYAQAPSTPLPFMQVWGRQDQTVRADGQPGSDNLIYETPEETALIWAEAQGCDTSTQIPYTTVSDGRKNWSCTQYPRCDQGSEVVTCAWDGAHVWPRDERGNFGWDALWAFFSKHSRTDQDD